MNKKNDTVYLGYVDEIIQDDFNDANYSTNKIGGLPNCPPKSYAVFPTRCNVCNVLRPLLVQCYAPLVSSPYHRTLYIFACVNPTCWNNVNSWSCIRVQYIAEHKEVADASSIEKNGVDSPSSSVDPWCSGADEWGEDDDQCMDIGGDSLIFSKKNESSSTCISKNRLSDSEDEMDDLQNTVQTLTISNKDQDISAEIEKSEENNIIVDDVNLPQNNLISLLNQVPDLLEEVKNGEIRFISKYISVETEYIQNDDENDHIDKLLQQYNLENKDEIKKTSTKSKSQKVSLENVEEYEKGTPRHGNEIFHNFVTRVQMNPTQIMRYSHDGQPLPMQPIPASLRTLKCIHCGGETCFELQILPTIIPSLKLTTSSLAYLEFGTVFVYTCKASCWKEDDTIKQEIVFMQREPV